jgi:peptidylprolyl isomerase
MRRITTAFAALALFAAVGCNQSSKESSTATSNDVTATQTPTETAPPATSTPADATTPVTEGEKHMLPGGIEVVELAPGTGAVATSGKHVYVHYTGTLTDGTKFDSSRDRGQPIDFVLGTGAVIKGWDQGIEGMKVGQRRRLTIPPALAYGERGYPGAIPPNATLVFDVELMDVK